MRLLLVLVAALVAAPAAFAHAHIDPTSIDAGKTATIHLTVPCESQTAQTVSVLVSAPAGVALSGTTAWNGRTAGDVNISFSARADKGGDYPLRVEQRYSDGRVVAWAGDESSDAPAPVLHVQGAGNSANRDRAIIIAAAIAAVLFVFALRRRRSR